MININERLFKQYNIDSTKSLDIETVCARPFDTVLIDKTGSCYACECQAWLPQSIGNLQVQSMEEILRSEMRAHIQSSVGDRSYRYCNSARCPYIKSNSIPEKIHTQHTQVLRLGIDESCNLRCPSCRNGLIFHKEGAKYNTAIKLADKINDWLHTTDQNVAVHMGSDGDPYASHVYRHFMQNTPRRANIKYWIMTNGHMFKEAHTQTPHINDNLTQLAVSIDGATKDTYEKLRLGGRWDKLLDNLESMVEQKDDKKFSFHWHMVVQKDNWHEMPGMVDLAMQHNVDMMFFDKIQNWNTNLPYDTSFTQLDEFKQVMKQVQGMSSIVRTEGLS